MASGLAVGDRRCYGVAAISALVEKELYASGSGGAPLRDAVLVVVIAVSTMNKTKATCKG